MKHVGTRNLAKVPFAADSPMHAEFPKGFDCEGCYFNGVNTWATDHADLYPGDPTPGITATAEAVEQGTGLSISYYALIDLRGFRDLGHNKHSRCCHARPLSRRTC